MCQLHIGVSIFQPSKTLLNRTISSHVFGIMTNHGRVIEMTKIELKSRNEKKLFKTMKLGRSLRQHEKEFY